MNLVPEYETLRAEIARLQDQVAHSIEISIIITSGILTISFSSLIGSEFQWLILMSPAIILVPFVFLILDRVKTTWFIGRYIELYLEPQLGFQWEAFNRKLRGGNNKLFRSRFTRTSISPLIGLQLLCPLLAISVGVPDIRIWLGVMGLIAAIIIIEIWAAEHYSISQKHIDVMKEAITSLHGDHRGSGQTPKSS